MRKNLPPLTWLRSFEAAARNLSFTAAAGELGLTQSAVSQQVKSLETRLRSPLFVRHARGLALTDAGRRLLPEVGGPLQALAVAMDGADAGPDKGLLTIAASVSVVQWVVAPLLPDFTRHHPALRLRFLSAIWPDDFQSARADLEIRFGSLRQAGENAVLLLPNRLVALKSPELSGALEELPLIEAVGTSGGWQTWAKEVGDTRPPSFYTDTYGMALQLAVHGNGVALVSELLAAHALKSGLLEPAHPASVAAEEGYYLSVAPEKPEAGRLRDWLLEKVST